MRCLAPALALAPALTLALTAAPVMAGPLSPALQGKTYIIQLTSSQFESGYGNYLVPPLAQVMAGSGLKPVRGPGADVAVTVEPGSDTGQWTGQGAARQWMYAATVTVGITPADVDIPPDGQPAFGVTARLVTPDRDREDELACLITLAARTALRDYQPKGAEQVDGQSCLRR